MYVMYSAEIKTQALDMRNSGKTVSSISHDLNIAESTLYRWFNSYETVQSITDESSTKQYEKLLAENQQLKNILTVIQRSNCIKEIPLRDRLNILEDFHKSNQGFSVYELCQALEIAKGTAYYHLFHRADTSKKDAEKYALMLKIHEIFEDSGQIYGADKIRAVLAREGIRVSNKRVSALMRELNLESIRVDAKKQYLLREKRLKKNLIKRNFTTTAPNRVWVSDITAFKVKGNWIYICVIIDLYSRKVVGFHISKNASTRLLTTTFKKAYQDRGMPKELTFHSDQGCQYTSKTFSKLLRDCNVKQSFSGPGQPLDNAVSESFFSSFKKEEAYRRIYTSERHFIDSVCKYIDFYNNIRPHKTIKNKAPSEFEARGKK